MLFYNMQEECYLWLSGNSLDAGYKCAIPRGTFISNPVQNVNYCEAHHKKSQALVPSP